MRQMEVEAVNDWFSWNGVKCTEYGIHVLEQPPPTIPLERVSCTSVPGRPGSLTILEGEAVYDDMVLAVQCLLADPAQIPAIAAWLRGSGKVAFANRQGGFYYARVANQISFEKILRGNPHRSFTVNFRCKPFWYEEAAQLLLYEPFTLVNPSVIPAEPVITVRGSGTVVLAVGDVSVTLENVSGSVTIDSEARLAYVSGASTPVAITLNDEVWPALGPGGTRISWSGGVSQVVVQPNWRWL